MSRLDNPAAAADAWSSGLAGSRQRYIDGVNSVTTPPGQAAAAAGDRWLANTTASLPRFKANTAAVTKEMWQRATIDKGADRLASGATAAKPKMESVMTRLFPAIKEERGKLPPRGGIDQNVERSRQFALGMNKRKGTFK